MPFPKVQALREEELTSRVPRVVSGAIELIGEIPREVPLPRTTFIDETPVLLAPFTVQFDLDFSGSETISLLSPLARPSVDGTIYIKRQQELFEQESPQGKIEGRNQKERLGSKRPGGLSIFELLLPVLMPPAATEFKDELLFPKELYPFQRAGVKWLFERKNALLADDMGLVKTVQTITAFRALIRRSKALHALIICPKSVVANWLRELEQWAPELASIAIQGQADIRRTLWRIYTNKCHVLIATYDIVRQDRGLIESHKFDLVVADEVQRIKNPSTHTAQAVRILAAERRWGLTGTPLENNLQDLVAIFSFVSPGLFQSNEISSLSYQAVRERVRPYVLRRRKEEALPQLPEKIVDTKWLELSDGQRAEYDRVEREGTRRLGTDENVSLMNVLALIQELKQLCNFEPKTGESSKLEFLVENFLPEACANGQKALVISQYVRTLENIAQRLKDYRPLIYTGELSIAQRNKVENDFSSRDDHRVILLSLRAGGVGINLTRANYVVHFDRWWNPAVERQAEDRTHRIGQLKTVFVTRFICRETIEEKIEKILERKRKLFREVIDEITDVNLERVLSEEELFGLFGLEPRRRQNTDHEPRRNSPENTNPDNIRRRPESSKGVPARIIRPEEPFSNLVQLRNILRESEEFIDWADLHFGPRALEELITTLDPAVVQVVRILSGPANVNDRAKRDFERFCNELRPKGIVAEWRILPDFAHDRFIISKKACYNVPPINSLLKGSYSEILETPNRPPFEEWWQKASPI